MKILSLILLLPLSQAAPIEVAKAQVPAQAQHKVKANRKPSADPVPVTCPNIRLDQNNGPMAHVAVRDQGSIGNCFAHVAAEVIDSWRFSHGDTNYPFQSSGMSLAFDYWGTEADKKPFSASTNLQDNQGGDVASALEVALKSGVCNKATSIEALSQSDIKDLFSKLQSTIQSEQKQAKLPADKQAPLSQDKTVTGFDKYVDKYDTDAEKELHETTGDGPLPAASTLAPVLRDADADAQLAKLLGQSCQGSDHLAVSFPKAREVIAFNRVEDYVLKDLRSLFARPKPQPVSLGICSQVLYQNEHYRGRTSTQAGGLTSECNDSLHAVIAVGIRQKSKTSCEYLIRSSWGKSCAGFGAGWKCEADTGSVWIDEADLVGNTQTYAVLLDDGTSQGAGK